MFHREATTPPAAERAGTPIHSCAKPEGGVEPLSGVPDFRMWSVWLQDLKKTGFAPELMSLLLALK